MRDADDITFIDAVQAFMYGLSHDYLFTIGNICFLTALAILFQ